MVLGIILGRKVMDVEYHQVEKCFQNLPGYKSIRLDVYAKDERGNVYNVEMQSVKSDDLAKRARYYQGMLDASGLLSGQAVKYGQLPRTYTFINVCYFYHSV